MLDVVLDGCTIYKLLFLYDGNDVRFEICTLSTFKTVCWDMKPRSLGNLPTSIIDDGSGRFD